ncbi:5402_t:CDS:2 [Entrophospora sp. SA101]|nr:5402_t:CDS:2 [Entrophospora sp. SA101]
MSPPNTPSPTVSRTVRMGQGAGPQPNLAGTSIQGIGRTATPPPRQPPNWQTTVTQPPGGQQGIVDPFITVIRSSSPPILPITQPIAIPVPTTQPQPPPPQPIAPQPMPPLVPFPQQPPVTTQQQQLPLPIPPVTVASTQPTQPPPGQPPVGGTFGLQHINTLVATQVTQLGQNVNALAMEIREGKVMSNQGNVSTVIKQDIGQGTAQKETNEQNVTIVEKKATYQVNGRNYQQRTNNNQQQPRRVLLNQEYHEEQQEPQYYTEYQPPVYYQNQQPIQNYQQQYLPPQPIQQQPQTDTFGALATAVHQLTSKLENLRIVHSWKQYLE